MNNQILLHILGEPDVSGVTRYFRDYLTFLSNIRPDQILNKPLPLGTEHWSGQNTDSRLVCKSQNRWLHMTKMRWWWGLDGVGWWWPVEQWVDKTCSAALLSPSLSTAGLPLVTTQWLLYLYMRAAPPPLTKLNRTPIWVQHFSPDVANIKSVQKNSAKLS